MLLFLLRKTPPPLPATPCASRVLSTRCLQVLEHPGGQLGGHPGGQEGEHPGGQLGEHPGGQLGGHPGGQVVQPSPEQEGAWDSMQSSVPSGSAKREISHCWRFSFSKEDDDDEDCEDDDDEDCDDDDDDVHQRDVETPLADQETTRSCL